MRSVLVRKKQGTLTQTNKKTVKPQKQRDLSGVVKAMECQQPLTAERGKD